MTEIISHNISSFVTKNQINCLIDKDWTILICMIPLWLLFPVPFMLVYIGFPLWASSSLRQGKLSFVAVMISLTFALLAFTQKSLYWDGTDIARYYHMLEVFASNEIPINIWDEFLFFVFTPCSIFISSLMGNVQYFSFFWTFVIYIFIFQTAFNLVKIICTSLTRSKTSMFLLLVFIVFGAVLFTQVTETIKSAAASSVFFYTFTCQILKEQKVKIILLYLISIGLHYQALLFLPMVFYRFLSFKKMFILTCLVVLVSLITNPIKLLSSFIPTGSNYLLALADKVNGYVDDDGTNSSKRYVFISFLILVLALFLYKKNFFNNVNHLGNIVLIYLTIMYFNYSNSVAFIRLANFGSFIFILEFVQLLRMYKNHWMKYTFLGMFIFLNAQMTLGRTISGGYCSSYMDNSLFKIFFSTAYDYLTFHAY